MTAMQRRLNLEPTKEESMPDAIDDLFRRFGKAFNKAELEEIAACVTDDFEWRLAAGTRPSGTVPKGKDDLRRYFGDKSQAHREARYSEARIHRAGDKLFGTFRVTGIDAKGQPLDRYGIDLYELRDGKIALKDSYLKAD
jgi:ketosteroid isomerase-like protein